MRKNGQVKMSEAKCSCGNPADTVDENGAPLCSKCALDYAGEEPVAHLDPSSTD